MGWSGHAGGSDATAAALAQRAKAGDQEALKQLYVAAGLDSSGEYGMGGAWRPDHRNAAIDAWNTLGLGPQTAQIKNPHGPLGDVGKGIGSVLKIAAPIAGALIPGVGTLGALAIGAGGSALGGAMHGDKFNLGKTLLAGGAAAAGNKLLGNGLGSTSAPGGIPAGGPTPGSGGAGSSGINPGSPSGGGGFLDRFGGIGGILQKYGPLALGAAGAFNQASQDNHAGQLRDRGVAMATDDWQSRAPLRAAAQQQLLAAPKPRASLAGVYNDPTDPYRSH